jgi:uncharacterized metal-binding protein YceD (DUF177 family)
MSGAPPFSRPVRVDALPADGVTQTIVADADERAALAALNHLPAIAKLTASFTLRRNGRDGARATGAVRADVTQVCVVTLEPFAAHIDEPLDVVFAPPAKETPARRGVQEEVNLDLAAEDPPDTMVDGVIDLGALAAEYLALGLDPYPRKPGVEFAASALASEASSPFAALAELKPEPKPKPKKKR